MKFIPNISENMYIRKIHNIFSKSQLYLYIIYSTWQPFFSAPNEDCKYIYLYKILRVLKLKDKSEKLMKCQVENYNSNLKGTYISILETETKQAFWENYAMIFLPVLVIKFLIYFLSLPYISSSCSIILIQHCVGRQPIIKT